MELPPDQPPPDWVEYSPVRHVWARYERVTFRPSGVPRGSIVEAVCPCGARMREVCMSGAPRSRISHFAYQHRSCAFGQ
jgi:hypothetical protein